MELLSVVKIETHPAPSEITEGKLFLVENGDIKKWACMMCPDGCGEIIKLSLNRLSHPSWVVEINEVGRPTLSPSVNKLDGCRSHFWVKNGKVEFCS